MFAERARRNRLLIMLCNAWCPTQAKEAKQAAKDAAGTVSGKAKETGAWAHDKTRDVVDSVASGHALQVIFARRRLCHKPGLLTDRPWLALQEVGAWCICCQEHFSKVHHLLLDHLCSANSAVDHDCRTPVTSCAMLAMPPKTPPSTSRRTCVIAPEPL